MYSPDFGRPSMNPVIPIKIPFIQYLYGFKSMRLSMKTLHQIFQKMRKLLSAARRIQKLDELFLGYSVNPGNMHDSRMFKSLYDKIKILLLIYLQ